MDGEEKEEWRDIPGYIGYYKMSNQGRVKSAARRWVIGAHAMYPTVKIQKAAILKGFVRADGVHIYGLTKSTLLVNWPAQKLFEMTWPEIVQARKDKDEQRRKRAMARRAGMGGEVQVLQPQAAEIDALDPEGGLLE